MLGQTKHSEFLICCMVHLENLCQDVFLVLLAFPICMAVVGAWMAYQRYPIVYYWNYISIYIYR